VELSRTIFWYALKLLSLFGPRILKGMERQKKVKNRYFRTKQYLIKHQKHFLTYWRMTVQEVDSFGEVGSDLNLFFFAQVHHLFYWNGVNDFLRKTNVIFVSRRVD
jgi:hypothetical protein